MVVAIATGQATAAAGRPPAPSRIIDQVGDWVVPQAPIRAAAAMWGIGFAYGGPPSCESSATGTQTACMVASAPPGMPRMWLGGWFRDGRGIILSPRLTHEPAWLQEAVAAHEIGNALGVPEEPCRSRDVMALCLTSPSQLRLP